jgi:glycosyltransferase involved in cell wall biosynthesis
MNRDGVGAARSRVLILDIGYTGHHPSYVRWLLESDLGQANVTLAGRPELLEHPEVYAAEAVFARREIEITAKLCAVLADSSPMGLIRSNWIIGRLYREICAEMNAVAPLDLVVVAFLDDCVLGLALPREAFGGIPWMAITMKTMFHYAEVGIAAPVQRFKALRRALFLRTLRQRSMISMLTIDPTLIEYADRRRDGALAKLTYLPDPARLHLLISPKVEARNRLSIPPESRVIALYGEIAARKGVYPLLDAAVHARCRPQLHVLLAGRCAERDRLVNYPAYRTLEEQGRLHILEGYLDQAHERLLLSAIDCMWLGYANFYGMSGILVLAGRHGVPVIASKAGLVGYLVRKHGLGLTVDPHNREDVTAALRRLVEQPEFFENAAGRGLEAFARHDPEEMKRIVFEKSRVAQA